MGMEGYLDEDRGVFGWGWRDVQIRMNGFSGGDGGMFGQGWRDVWMGMGLRGAPAAGPPHRDHLLCCDSPLLSCSHLYRQIAPGDTCNRSIFGVWEPEVEKKIKEE